MTAMDAGKGRRRGNGAEGSQPAWKNWPPAYGSRPLLLKNGTSAPSRLYAFGGRKYTVGEWTVCGIDDIADRSYIAVVSKDGHVAPWSLYFRSANKDDAIKVCRNVDHSHGPERKYVSNYITGGTAPDGTPEVLLEEWGEGEFSDFEEGLACIVQKDGFGLPKCEWIRRSDGSPLPLYKWENGTAVPDPDPGITTIQGFHEGFAVAERHGDYNWYGKDGIPLLKGEWMSLAKDFSGGWGVAKRKKDGRCNFVGGDGRMLSDTWFEDVRPFGAHGNPGWAKSHNGVWRIIYGRKRDGTPELSRKSLWRDCIVNDFSCGRAVIADFIDGIKQYGCVDENLNDICPRAFGSVGKFAEDFMRGEWTKVIAVYGGGGLTSHNANETNLMARDGTLAFFPEAQQGGWPNDIFPDGRLGNHLIIIEWEGKNYGYNAGPDYSRIDETGACIQGNRSLPLDGKGGRLYFCTFKDRSDGKESEGFAVADSLEVLRPICSTDGKRNKCI